MSDNKCGTGIASQLTADTFIGTDCKGNKMNAGSKFASCSDLQQANAGIEAIRQTANNAKNNANDAKDEAGKATQKAEEAKTEAGNATNEAKDAKRDASSAVSTANGAVATAQNALNKSIARVNAEGDRRDIILQDGTKIPFYITDKVVPVEPLYQDEKVVGFGVKGDNVVITMIDGTEHDLTRQEFADWLSAQDSALTTDQELADAIANGTGDLQSQLEALQAQLDAINTDQATHFVRGLNLVLKNEDGSESIVPLKDLIPLSGDTGQQIEWREDGIYYGDIAPPSLGKLYVDAELGSDSILPENGGGSINKPFKTYQHALDISPSDKGNKIFLKATDSLGNQQTYYHTKRNFVDDNAVREVYMYGQYDEVQAWIDCLTARPQTAVKPINTNEIVRPRIVKVWQKVLYAGQDRQSIPTIQLRNGGSINYYGIEQDLSLPTHDVVDYPPYVLTTHFGTGSISYYGCDIQDYEDNVVRLYQAGLGDNVKISFNRTGVKDLRSNVENMFSIGFGQATFISNNSDYAVRPNSAQEDCGSEFTEKNGNTTQVLTTVGIIDGIQRDDSGTPLNASANFNL